MSDSDDLVRPIPTRWPYPTPDGVAVPVWVTRHGRHVGDVDLMLATADDLAQVLADPAQVSHIAAQARTRPGTVVRPLTGGPAGP